MTLYSLHNIIMPWMNWLGKYGLRKGNNYLSLVAGVQIIIIWHCETLSILTSPESSELMVNVLSVSAVNLPSLAVTTKHKFSFISDNDEMSTDKCKISASLWWLLREYDILLHLPLSSMPNETLQNLSPWCICSGLIRMQEILIVSASKMVSKLKTLFLAPALNRRNHAITIAIMNDILCSIIITNCERIGCCSCSKIACSTYADSNVCWRMTERGRYFKYMCTDSMMTCCCWNDSNLATDVTSSWVGVRYSVWSYVILKSIRDNERIL